MTTPYIRNKGITETIFQNGKQHRELNKIKWDADYNGDLANLKVNINNNGKKKKVQMQFTNDDLAAILSIPAVNKPLEQRLQDDFLSDEKEFTGQEFTGQEFAGHEFMQPEFMQPEFMETEVQPEPILFQMNLPETSSELSSISSMTSLSEVFHSIPTKLTKREKLARLKTPSPRTMRIHYTTARGQRKKGKSLKKSKTNKTNKTSKRRYRRVIPTSNQNPTPLAQFFGNRF
jgi:hypothetical protein